MRPTPTPRANSGRVLALLCVIYFMVILDAAIVRIAIPPMQTDLGLSPAEETWVANSYMLTFGALLLLCGRFADVLGRRRMLLAGVALFTIASLLGPGWQWAFWISSFSPSRPPLSGSCGVATARAERLSRWDRRSKALTWPLGDEASGLAFGVAVGEVVAAEVAVGLAG